MKRLERLIPSQPHIHLDAGNHIVECLTRQIEAADIGLKSLSLTRLGSTAVEAPVQLLAPASQLCFDSPSLCTLPESLIDHIVHGTAEVPYCNDGVPLGARKDHEGVIEVGVAAHG